MKAIDLMIGDYVTFSDCIDNPPLILIKIEALGYQEGGGEDSSLVRIDNEKACDIIDIDDEIVGIPLTPAILEKNGFMPTYGRGELVLKTSDYGVWVDFDTNSIWVSIRVELKEKPFSAKHYYEGYLQTIHQLQHALKLCGIEKEIIL